MGTLSEVASGSYELEVADTFMFVGECLVDLGGCLLGSLVLCYCN